jgi:4-phospho-D-threonate 3-dehydrogenase / 4-phospho-D-erythronate 3-dehydrogenase
MTNHHSSNCRVVITLGDPTGIGPEIVVKALSNPQIYQHCSPIVIGRPNILRRAVELLGVDSQVVEAGEDLREEPTPSRIVCFTSGHASADDAPAGKVDARGGQAAYDFLLSGTRLVLDNRADAIVTAPLHKGALHAAGHSWPGHTELLADLCGVKEFAMMLYLPPNQAGRGGAAGLGVIHVTLHMAMRDIFRHLTTSAIDQKIQLAHGAFTKFRVALGLPPSPALAVAALNPHAGEGGLFGDEEARMIAPAVEMARSRGWNVQGPLAVDTLMPRAVAGEFDAVIAMYHDQGHIALKLLDMFDAVNITLGLPIIRTSVAHGTAHDIAWQGQSRASGMVQAILSAAWLAQKR